MSTKLSKLTLIGAKIFIPFTIDFQSNLFNRLLDTSCDNLTKKGRGYHGNIQISLVKKTGNVMAKTKNYKRRTYPWSSLTQISSNGQPTCRFVGKTFEWMFLCTWTPSFNIFTSCLVTNNTLSRKS